MYKIGLNSGAIVGSPDPSLHCKTHSAKTRGIHVGRSHTDGLDGKPDNCSLKRIRVQGFGSRRLVVNI